MMKFDLIEYVVIYSVVSSILIFLAMRIRYEKLGKRLLASDPFFLVATFFFLYNVAGQYGRTRLDAFPGEVYYNVSIIVCLSSLCFLLATIATPASSISKDIRVGTKSGNAFIYGGLISLVIGYIFWIINYGRVGGVLIAFSNFSSRIDRNEMLTSLPGNIPYTHFMLVAHCFLLAGFLIKGRSIRTAVMVSTVTVSPLLIFFLLDGERTSLLRHLISSLFTVFYLRLGGNVTFNRKWVKTGVALFVFLALLGNFRSAVQVYIGTGSTEVFTSQVNGRGFGLFIPAEFHGVNYTTNRIVHEIMYENQDLQLGASYAQAVAYLFPRSVYSVFELTKAPTIADQLGQRVAREIGRERALGFGMSGVAESYANFSFLGPLLYGFLLVFSVSLWRSLVRRAQSQSPFTLVYLLMITPIFLLVHRVAFASAFSFLVHLFVISATMYLVGVLLAQSGSKMKRL